jgi:hypothetical protein
MEQLKGLKKNNLTQYSNLEPFKPSVWKEQYYTIIDIVEISIVTKIDWNVKTKKILMNYLILKFSLN